MRTTSHFIGILLDSSYFAELFVDLQSYFEKHGLGRAIELQNILSLHITLYYLDNSITKEEKVEIAAEIAAISSDKTPTISHLGLGYFGESGNERVCYLSAQADMLARTNQLFAQKYDYSHVPENQLAFVPHISFFRIQDSEAYSPHKAEVDKIIAKNVKRMELESHSYIKGVHLFQVNSMFHPELQVAI